MYCLRILLDLHDRLNELSQVQLLRWIQYLNSNTDSSLNIDPKFILIAGVFLRLYKSRKSNNVNLLKDLLEHANDLKTTSKKKNKHGKKTKLEKNVFSTIPTDLLCYIATYLKIKELFCIFNRICKESCRAGMKCQSIQYWSLEYSNNNKFHQSTKYDIVPLYQMSNI